MSSILHSEDEAETRELGVRLAAYLVPDGILLLSGELGSGKTVLAQGIAQGMGIDPLQVQSPSFTLIREHEGSRGRMVHIDLYRLEEPAIESLGLWEILAEPAVKVVEWAERIPFAVAGALRVEIEVLHPSQRRRLVVHGLNDSGAETK